MNDKKRKNVPFKGKTLKMQRVAYHEAAHAVFCVLFKQKFKYAQVDIEQNDSLVDGIEKRTYSDCSCQNCENKLKEVWMMIDIAGFVAENIFLSRNAHQEDVNWKRVERKLFENMEDRDGRHIDFDILQQPSRSFTISRTYISDFTWFHEDLKCVMDFHNFGRYQEKYEFRYECFFMYKCAQILEQRSVWKAVAAVAERLVDKSIATDVRIINICKKIWGFESVANHLSKIYTGQ